jgi:glycolate oxidase FAD binding subunit
MTIADHFARHLGEAPRADGVPDDAVLVAPSTIEEAAEILLTASEHGVTVCPWGGGTHQGLGGAPAADLILSTTRLDRMVDWQPDDLTVTVEAGMKVADLEGALADRGQSAILPEIPGAATVGGVVAAGVSGWRRARYGPTRERILEVDLVTGDGRHIRAGARVVKNVTGFDLSRLTVGSLGRLGLIARVCLKLWPVPSTRATVEVADGDAALARAYRPTAVVETNGTTRVFLGGTEAEVTDQSQSLGGESLPGWQWVPEPVDEIRWSIRVPPARVRAAIERLPRDWGYQAGLGVGEIRAASATSEGAEDLRMWAESVGGNLVIVDGPDTVYRQLGAWGTAPPGIEIQRRIVERFDPDGVMNPGRLPGGL